MNKLDYSVSQESQRKASEALAPREKVALHFHIPQARCECGGYALVYPIHDEQWRYGNECNIMLSCVHEIDAETMNIALKHYARRIFVIREHKQDCIK